MSQHGTVPTTSFGNYGSNVTNSQATSEPDNLLICDRSGFKVRIAEGLKTEWTGLMVKARFWEPRHPQDFVRGVSEHLRGSPRPEPDDVFLSQTEVQDSDLPGG